MIKNDAQMMNIKAERSTFIELLTSFKITFESYFLYFQQYSIQQGQQSE